MEQCSIRTVHVRRKRLRARNVLPTEVVVQILMHINRGVIDRILDLVHNLGIRRAATAGGLIPAMAYGAQVSSVVHRNYVGAIAVQNIPPV